jgi:hypothetical protein
MASLPDRVGIHRDPRDFFIHIWGTVEIAGKSDKGVTL